jgi:predicted aspartyl protease
VISAKAVDVIRRTLDRLQNACASIRGTNPADHEADVHEADVREADVRWRVRGSPATLQSKRDPPMGHVFETVTLKAKRARRVRMLVDTGARYCQIPPELARAIGATMIPERFTVTLANKKRVRYPAATVSVRVDGRKAAAIALVGPCPMPLLSVEALEALGLAVDPKRGKLRALPGYAGVLMV